MRSSILSSAGLAAAALALSAGTASAASAPAELPAVERTLEASRAAAVDCTARTAGRGIDTTTYRAPMSGFVSIRSRGARRSDWDLAVLDAASGRRLGASQGFGASEVVQTFVTAGQRLRIRGCRRSGRASTLPVSVVLADVQVPKSLGTPSLMKVKFRSNADLRRIEQAGLDLTHHIHDGEADVIVTGAGQLAKLAELGLPFETEIEDLNAHYRASRKADAAYTARVAGDSPLPSGRTTYRSYEDYQAELKSLAEGNPGLVKPVTLPHRTLQGREVTGIEIARDVDRTDDGRPTYFLVATHHAREWPSGEAAMELAHLLVQGFGEDERITRLLENERVVIVPLINPDGYVESRTAFSPADTTGDSTLQTAEIIAPYGGSLAYRRKNCNGAIPSGNVPCVLQYGVDPNRNYGEGWGGRGAGSDPTTQSYRGPGPWSEPETQNVHEFSQGRQITNIVSIHTVAALVLRPPGRSDDGKAPDEQRMKEIGDAMAEAAGYTSQYSFQLYDTSGTTEDWNYAAAGSYGYTIEMGPQGGEFHMPYETGVVEQWTGKAGTPSEGRGLREALLIAAEAAANPADHGVLTGKAQPGSVLRVRKEFQTRTSEKCTYAQGYLNVQGGGTPLDCAAPGARMTIDDHLDSTLTVGPAGTFEWHVTPSTRPFVGARYVEGEPVATREPMTFAADAADNKLALGAVDKEQGTVQREFVVDDTAGANAMKVALEWGLVAEDYDIELFRKGADGTLEPAGTSGSFGSYEAITVADPRPGTYVLKIVYYATASNDWKATVSFTRPGDDRVEPTGTTEAWTLTCERPDGTVLGTKEVTVARGQRVDLGTVPGCAAKKPRGPRKGRR